MNCLSQRGIGPIPFDRIKKSENCTYKASAAIQLHAANLINRLVSMQWQPIRRPELGHVIRGIIKNKDGRRWANCPHLQQCFTLV